MEIRRLQYFVCIAELGSLGRAADILRIAQPALTRQVRLLEQELGVTLFTRTRRGMHLTDEGSQLLSDVTEPLRQLEGALQNMRSLTSGLSGHVAVGMTPTVTYFLAQPLLERMAEVAPDVVLRIVEGTGLHLGEGLMTGELDMGLLYEALHDHRLVNRDLLTEELVVVGSPQSGLAPEREQHEADFVAEQSVADVAVKRGDGEIVVGAARRFLPKVKREEGLPLLDVTVERRSTREVEHLQELDLPLGAKAVVAHERVDELPFGAVQLGFGLPAEERRDPPGGDAIRFLRSPDGAEGFGS